MKKFVEVNSEDLEEITKSLFLEAVKGYSNEIFCNEKLYDLLSNNAEYSVFLSKNEEHFGIVGNVKLYLDKSIENDVPKFAVVRNFKIF